MDIRESYESGDKPFRWWIADGVLEPAAAADVPAADWPHWEAAYDNDVERSKYTSRCVEQFPVAARAALRLLESQMCSRWWREHLGLDDLFADPDRHGAGLHMTREGGFLQVHADYELHPTLAHKERRLNLVAFLHPEWKPEWGGQLLLCDPGGKAVQEIEPVPGRVALFECGPASYHGVRVLRPGAPPRLSLAVYYLSTRRSTAVRTRAVFLPNRSRTGVPVEVA